MNPTITETYTEKFIKSLAFGILLYPLQRIQTVKQIQLTYTNNTFRQSKNIMTQCTHYGVKSMFRGLCSYLLRGGTLLISIQTLNDLNFTSNKKIELGVVSSILGVIYVGLYPLQVLRMRICGQLERQSYYNSMNECLKKIKKNQGIRVLYQGLPLGLLHFYLQFSLTYVLFDQVVSLKSKQYLANNLAKVGLYIIASQLFLYPFETLKLIQRYLEKSSKQMEHLDIQTLTQHIKERFHFIGILYGMDFQQE